MSDNPPNFYITDLYHSEPRYHNNKKRSRELLLHARNARVFSFRGQGIATLICWECQETVSWEVFTFVDRTRSLICNQCGDERIDDTNFILSVL